MKDVLHFYDFDPAQTYLVLKPELKKKILAIDQDTKYDFLKSTSGSLATLFLWSANMIPDSVKEFVKDRETCIALVNNWKREDSVIPLWAALILCREFKVDKETIPANTIYWITLVPRGELVFKVHNAKDLGFNSDLAYLLGLIAERCSKYGDRLQLDIFGADSRKLSGYVRWLSGELSSSITKCFGRVDPSPILQREVRRGCYSIQIPAPISVNLIRFLRFVLKLRLEDTKCSELKRGGFIEDIELDRSFENARSAERREFIKTIM